MIFVTLGTQDKGFERLLVAIDAMIESGIIKDEIVVQAGHTKYISDKMQIFDYISMDKFNEYIEKCDLLITHGGVGSILSGCLAKKKVLAVARLARYDEHESDHQVQIVTEFNNRGYILGCTDAALLAKIYQGLEQFTPREYQPNNGRICQIISEYIKNL